MWCLDWTIGVRRLGRRGEEEGPEVWDIAQGDCDSPPALLYNKSPLSLLHQEESSLRVCLKHELQALNGNIFYFLALP